MTSAEIDSHQQGRAIRRSHWEIHLVQRIGWLRAAVLGANDGIISTASLILGVAGASSAKADILLASVAAMVAGAMSMAAGEYVSVSSQSDTERADLQREREELAAMRDQETEELAEIYVGRGVEPKLAHEVAKQLMENDALQAHARDELGISEITTARHPSGAYLRGDLLGRRRAAAAPRAADTGRLYRLVRRHRRALAGLGFLGDLAGGAGIAKPVARVTFWGALAMAVTYTIGSRVGMTV